MEYLVEVEIYVKKQDIMLSLSQHHWVSKIIYKTFLKFLKSYKYIFAFEIFNKLIVIF